MDTRLVTIERKDWIYLKSTNLWAITFLDSKTLKATISSNLPGNLAGVIAIVFRKRDKWVYLYENCFFNEFVTLLNASSKGQYFRTVIKFRNFWKIQK